VARTFSSKDAAPPASGRRQEAVAEIWVVPPVRFTTRAGTNRFVWDLKYAEVPLALPGTYQVRLKAAGKTLVQPLEVKEDPRSTATPAELTKQFAFIMQCAKAIAQAAGNPQALAQLRTALAVAQSADRTPPAVAYTLYEEALKALNQQRAR